MDYMLKVAWSNYHTKRSVVCTKRCWSIAIANEEFKHLLFTH